MRINRLILALLIFLSGCYPREEPGQDPEEPENDRREPCQTIVVDTTTNEIITDTIYIEI